MLSTIYKAIIINVNSLIIEKLSDEDSSIFTQLAIKTVQTWDALWLHYIFNTHYTVNPMRH